jgi:hypothetical protein
MNIRDAWTTYLYLEHQRRNKDQQLKFEQAWKAICKDYERIEYASLTDSNGDKP